ncbi:MAG: hypothetical protein F6K18_33805 [Okeania sp. SIO2C2]|nr:hypothetical protein [Okeania sp. SIO2C2]NEP91377.1 hypothetical protein [Okeania sp. SIO2C2]
MNFKYCSFELVVIAEERRKKAFSYLGEKAFSYLGEKEREERRRLVI